MKVEDVIMEFEYRSASCEFEERLNLIEYSLNFCDFFVESSNSNWGKIMQEAARELKKMGSEPHLIGNYRSEYFLSIFFNKEPKPDAIEYLKTRGRLTKVILLPSKFSMYHPSDFPVHSLSTDFPVYPLPTNTVYSPTYSPTTVLSPVHKK